MTDYGDAEDEYPEQNLITPGSTPPVCELCGQYLDRRYELRVAEAGPSTVGPVYFCSEDCREEWRHHAPSDSTVDS